jgi:hypothetical protein
LHGSLERSRTEGIAYSVYREIYGRRKRRKKRRISRRRKINRY